jgi:hypothetical protein
LEVPLKALFIFLFSARRNPPVPCYCRLGWRFAVSNKATGVITPALPPTKEAARNIQNQKAAHTSEPSKNDDEPAARKFKTGQKRGALDRRKFTSKGCATRQREDLRSDCSEGIRRAMTGRQHSIRIREATVNFVRGKKKR